MTVTYAVRQILGTLGSPWVIALVLVVTALACGLWGRGTARRWLLVCAALIGYLGSTSLVGGALLAPLEQQFAPLRADQRLPTVGYVVVLGSGYNPRDEVPITAALDRDGLARIVEGVRLLRRLGAARLVISGGAPPGKAAPATGYAILAKDLGVPPSSLVISDRALNTVEEARVVARLVGSTPFILITSAYHMPRAVRLMRRAGTSPIPAPTGQRVDATARIWRALLPSPGGLDATQRALHEYLGLAAIATGLE